VAERACAWLKEQNGDQPFFLMVSFPDPHHPFNPPGKYWDMYDPGDMPIPAAFGKNDWTPPPHVAAILRDREDGSANLGTMAAIGALEKEVREAQALTCGMVAMIDDAVGRVRQSPNADTAITIFTSDHGDHLGDHRMLFKGAAAYEEVTRVPFIWSDPDYEQERETDEIAQTHDIGVSILERAKIEPAIGMQGKTLGTQARKAAFIQYDRQSAVEGIGDAPRVHTIRTRDWRMTLFDGVDWGELYDLSRDPGEFDNLWNSPEAAGTRAALTEALLRLEIDTIDRVPLPTGFA
jgi:arylsulfatase A-like enzyme